MAHPQQQNFVASLQKLMPQYFNNKKVLEVGSLNINGTIRTYFTDCDYTGIDLGEGPCVDIVCAGQDLDHPDNTYDTVASTECFEHNPYWAETFANMIRMCKSGGLVFMTCATTGRPEHGTSRTNPKDSPLSQAIWDYYKNLTEEDFREKFNIDDLFIFSNFIVSLHDMEDLYFYGIKK